ncbi:MAG: hypothetical protein DMD96_07190 [Candidatus Rokuibacteriota bacterium]|nr:MAG: hypothetical protein DMD96_07190 [Candidatus Rokubacteria bacterium]
MTIDPERFRAISLDDLTMPGGWSVSSGQTFLYTEAEERLMREIARSYLKPQIGSDADAPAQRESVQAIFRSVRLMRIVAGSDEIMKFLVARELLREVKG